MTPRELLDRIHTNLFKNEDLDNHRRFKKASKKQTEMLLIKKL